MINNSDFFFFSVFLWWFCDLWIATTSAKSRNDEGGKGWYSQTRHCESCLQLVAISVWGTINHSWNSFSFLFLYLLLVVCGLLRFTRNDSAPTWSLREPRVRGMIWQSSYCINNWIKQQYSTPLRLRRFPPYEGRQYPHTIIAIIKLSLRGFEKAVAISLWQPSNPTHIVIARAWKARGNLGMGYNY